MKNLIGRFTPVICFVFLAIFVFAATNYAQDLDDVTFSGRIVDSNNAPIVGATLTATLVTTNAERTVTTDEDGRFRITDLAPGLYKVRASQTGFGTQEKIDLETIAGQNVQLDFSLAPGDVRAEQTVTIEADTTAVDVTRTVVGGTITQREVEELPNNSRDALDLVFTLGGVSEEPLSTRDLAQDRASGRNDTAPGNTPEEAGIFALSGGAAYSNNLTIDGFDNNDDRTAGVRFQPSIEGIDEVQVITNQFSAEYGRASGGRVNIRTRGGSKNLRGRVFYFFRDESLNANTYRNNSQRVARPAFQENIPGFTLGGPIPFGYFKNKTFFFTSYEHQNVYDTALTDTFVPVQQNPRFTIPAPTNPNITITNPGGVLLGRYLAGTLTPQRDNAFTARIDHNFTDTHNITVSYQLGRSNNKRRFNGGNTLPEGFLGRISDTDAINFADNYVFNSKAVNQFRLQYSQLEPRFTTTDLGTKPVVLIGINDENNRFQTVVVGSSLGASDRREKRWQFQDTLSYVAGAQTLRFGFDVQRVNNTFIDLTDAGGTYNFNNANNYLLSNTSRYRQNFFTESGIKNTYYGIFAQDDWRVFPNVTLTLGLRYEQESVIDDKNNFGPRVAVAYNPFKDNKGVIRFGAGIFYNRVLLRTVDDFTRGGGDLIEFDTNRIPTGSLRTSFLTRLSATFPNTLTPDSQIVRDYVNAGYNNTPFLRQLSPDIQVPESYQFNVGFEREVGDGFVVEANLTYNHTVRLWRETNINAPRIPNGFNNFTDYLVAVSGQGGFNNACVPGVGRPIYNPGTLPANNCSTGAGDIIRFQLAPTPNNGSVQTTGNVTIVNLNSTNSDTAQQIAIASIRNFRPDPRFTQVEQVGSVGNSWYRGLVLEARRRYRKLGYGFGSSFRLAYTLSKLEDDGIVNTSNAQVYGDFSAERAESLISRRHRFAFSGVFDTPRWLGKLQLSPLFRIGSAGRFNISNGGNDNDDRNLNDTNTDRPNFSGNLEGIRVRNPGDPLNPALVNAFTIPPIGTAGGNLPRNAGIGPGQFIFDLTLSRRFEFGERVRLRPSIEFGNILNKTVFSFGSEFLNVDDAQLFVPTRTTRQRQIRLGIRLDF